MAFAWENWKWNGDDGDWQEWFSRLDLDKQLEIRELADKQFDGDIVAAMKHKFRWNIAKVLYRKPVEDKWQEMIQDPQFQKDFRKLLEGLENIDDTTPVDPDAETKKKKKK